MDVGIVGEDRPFLFLSVAFTATVVVCRCRYYCLRVCCQGLCCVIALSIADDIDLRFWRVAAVIV